MKPIEKAKELLESFSYLDFEYSNGEKSNNSRSVKASIIFCAKVYSFCPFYDHNKRDTYEQLRSGVKIFSLYWSDVVKELELLKFNKDK